MRARLIAAAMLAVGVMTVPVVGSAIESSEGSDCAEPAPAAATDCVAESASPSDVSAQLHDRVGWAAEAAATEAAASAGVLWRADHEEGDLSDWDRDDCGGQFDNGAAYTEFSNGTRNGSGGMRLRVPDMNTGNSEGARAFRWCESRQHQALYYSAWYYIPEKVRVDGWWWLMEWKSEGSYNAKLGLAVANRSDGAMYIGLGRGSDSGGGWWPQSVANLPVGRWFHLEVYYKKAADATGRVTVWQDGVRIIDLAGVQTANSSDLGWAVINYGQYTRPADVEIYIDDVTISTQRPGP
ncbi:MAG: polysaccharide lyase [Chloroflexota bacterium]|nr:polysaccharide lyase [Chloroflexota bacterium]